MMRTIRDHGGSCTTLIQVEHLRQAAWRPILGDEASSRFGIDDYDLVSWHVLTWHGDDLVAAGRLTVFDSLDEMPETRSFATYLGSMELPAAVAGRLVVHPAHRSRGLAAQIITERLVLAAELGVREVWGETRTEQIEGLETRGYDLLAPSDDHSVPGEWHIMRARL